MFPKLNSISRNERRKFIHVLHVINYIILSGSSSSLEEAFFDTISITDSDDEFHSVHGGM